MIFYKTSASDDPYYDLWNSSEWLFPFESKSLTFPKILTMETTNLCQQRCFYCSRNLMNRKIAYFDLGLMEKVATEASKYNASIRFGGWGEPLLHKKCVDILKVCKGHGIRTTIFTNAQLLDESKMEAFCEMGLDEIRFSTAGLTPEDHNEVRIKSDYERDFRSKIRMAHEVRSRFSSKKPYFSIYTHVFDYSENGFEEKKNSYIDYYLNYVDKIDIDLTNLCRVKDLDKVKPYFIRSTINQTYKPCVNLYLKMIIFANGDLYACDQVYEDDDTFLLGNLSNSPKTIFDLYHSEKAVDLRNSLRNLEHARYSLCKDCYSNTTKYEPLKEQFKQNHTQD